MNTSSPNGLQSDINVTPLVDVVLVLLIIFMIVMPLAMRGYDMNVPGEATATLSAPHEPLEEQVVLAIRVADCPVTTPLSAEGLPAACSVWLNDERLPVAELGESLQQLYADRSPTGQVLFLAADDALNYECVMRIVDTAKASVHNLQIGLVTSDPA